MKKRITTFKRDGQRIYEVGAWPGAKHLGEALFVLAILALIAGVYVFFAFQIRSFITKFTELLGGSEWIATALSFVIGGAIDLSIIIVFGLILLYAPLFFIRELSKKQVWIEDHTIVQKIYFLGIPFIRRFSSDRILNLEVVPSGSIYNVTMTYERKLPKLVFAILVYWNKKLTTWRTFLLNAIPDKAEAREFIDYLMQHITLPEKKPTS